MLVAFATVLGILIVDQGLKFWVLTHLALGQQMELVPGFLSLTYIQNRGASWGILPGTQGLFIGTILAWRVSPPKNLSVLAAVIISALALIACPILLGYGVQCTLENPEV